MEGVGEGKTVTSRGWFRVRGLWGRGAESVADFSVIRDEFHAFAKKLSRGGSQKKIDGFYVLETGFYLFSVVSLFSTFHRLFFLTLFCYPAVN